MHRIDNMEERIAALVAVPARGADCISECLLNLRASMVLQSPRGAQIASRRYAENEIENDKLQSPRGAQIASEYGDCYHYYQQVELQSPRGAQIASWRTPTHRSTMKPPVAVPARGADCISATYSDQIFQIYRCSPREGRRLHQASSCFNMVHFESCSPREGRRLHPRHFSIHNWNEYGLQSPRGAQIASNW